jgi:F0F1-type ATP synthase membrane subunit b/b'
MLKDKKEIDLLVKELHDEAERNIQRIEDGFNRAADDIALRVDAHFGRIRNEAKREVQRLLDEGESREGEINQKISTLIKDGAKSIEREVDKRIKILEEELRLIINESEKRLHWKFRFGRVQGDGIDIRSILEELSVGFGYIFSKIFDLGSSILGIVVAFGINPLLGVITMIVSFFRQGRGWFKHDPGKRLRNAKERASKEIEKYFDRLDKSFQKNLSNELEKVRREMRSHVRQFRNLAMAIKDFSRLMNKFLEIIQEQMTAISTELAKYVLQSRVIDACVIDLGLQSACIIGRVEKEERLKEKRLKNDLRVNRLYIYSSFKDFLNNLDHRIEDGALIVTDPNEFKRRVASALKKAMGFETIRKERSYAN